MIIITDGDILTMIDFTMCEIDLTANYGGSDQKRGILYQNKRYMLKMPDRISDDKRNSLNSSYSNSAYSEHICCEILKGLGFDVQETLLGFITDKNGVNKPVVACRNFVPEGYSLIDFRAMEDALLIDRKAGKIPRITDIYEIMGKENAYFSKETGVIAMQKYWDTFILDAMLGNFDRHANNWAYLIKNNGTGLKPAPIYDCGSCLYPQVSDAAIPAILLSPEEIQMRIDKFPTAALELQDKSKANYKDYINSLQNPDCTAALLRVYPKIDRKVIQEIINEISVISDIRKNFYTVMIQNRIESILEPAYENACLHSYLNDSRDDYERIQDDFDEI